MLFCAASLPVDYKEGLFFQLNCQVTKQTDTRSVQCIAIKQLYKTKYARCTAKQSVDSVSWLWSLTCLDGSLHSSEVNPDQNYKILWINLSAMGLHNAWIHHTLHSNALCSIVHWNCNFTGGVSLFSLSLSLYPNHWGSWHLPMIVMLLMMMIEWCW